MHISDLHERGPREREPYRRRRVLGDAWKRNLDALLEDGPVDLLCFTGDVADRGAADEYAGATELLDALCTTLGLARDRLFVVPGNHDIARSVEAEAWAALRRAIERGVSLQEISRWMAGHAEAPLGVDGGLRDRILARQESYRRWVREDLGRPELDPSASPHGSLGFRSTLTVREGLPKVHVIGLDTAWLAGDDADARRLLLTEDQLMLLATDPEGKPLPGLRIALMHHPLHDLVDGSHIRRLLADHVDVVLRGHLHETAMETWSDPDRRTLELAVGCLYEGHSADQHPNACHVLTLDLREGGAEIAGTSRFRAFSPRAGHWHDDDSLYRESRGGRLSWSVRQPARDAASSTAPRGERTGGPGIAAGPRPAGRPAWIAPLVMGLAAVTLLGELVSSRTKHAPSEEWIATFRLAGSDPDRIATIEIAGGCRGAGRASAISVAVLPGCDRPSLDLVVSTESFEPFSYRVDAAAARSGNVAEIRWTARPTLLAGTITYDDGKPVTGARVSLLGCAFSSEERVDVNNAFKLAVPAVCRSLGPPFHLQVTPPDGPPHDLAIDDWMTNRLTLRRPAIQSATTITSATTRPNKPGDSHPGVADPCAVGFRRIRPKTWEAYCSCGSRAPLGYVVPDTADGKPGDGIAGGKAMIAERGWSCP